MNSQFAQWQKDPELSASRCILRHAHHLTILRGAQENCIHHGGLRDGDFSCRQEAIEQFANVRVLFEIYETAVDA